ncbi:hypothetical protein THIOKS12690008 [Thiocapsa sp. KS1]|nr:hypothetical protein [Thiocapsa sp. KS1]CRI66227.1 hypothetical protein THIOKS12690008 [Thiocapsa sp. KS1]
MNQTHRTASQPARPSSARPRPARPADSETDLADLDALVLAEIESLTAHRAGARSKQAPCGDAPTPAANGGAREPKAKASVAPIRSAPERRRESFGEEAELLFEEPEPADDNAADSALAGLLSPEEEAFITRAVGFLSQRPEADIILNRIWEQLTELDPEGYYQAPLDPPERIGRETPPESESSTATPPADPPEG